MRQTRSSIVLQAAAAEVAAKSTRSSAKKRQSLAVALTESEEVARKKINLAASKLRSNGMSDDDVRSVHSEESDDVDVEVQFTIKCLKCDAKFSRKSYLFTHFKLAHNIDLSQLTPEKKGKNSGKIETNFKKERLSYPRNGSKKIEDEDYFSCSSSFSSEICFVEKTEEDVSSDLDVENNLDTTTVCPDCNTPIVTNLDAESHVNKKCLLRKLSVEHQDIILNQPFVNLQRLSKVASRKRRHNIMKFPHVCPLCGVRFASNIDMKIHAQMEHRVDPNLMKYAKGNGDDDRKFLAASKKQRSDCDKKPNPKKSDLAQNGSGKVACQTCSKSFGSKVKLDQHIEKSHPNLVKTPKYDHNADPLAKALAKRMRLTKKDPKTRVKSLFNFMGLRLQLDQSKWI